MGGFPYINFPRLPLAGDQKVRDPEAAETGFWGRAPSNSTFIPFHSQRAGQEGTVVRPESYLISPPAPVAAPGNGAIAVG